MNKSDGTGGGRRRHAAMAEVRKVPDISLFGFHDVPRFGRHEAGIIALAQPVDKIGDNVTSITGSRLSQRGFSHEPRPITLNCDLILRGTRRLART